jgi:hypothetical protein
MTRKGGDINGERPVVESFEKCSILFKYKKGENFNHPREIGFAFHGAGTNTLSILRINPLKFGGGLKFEPDAGIGQNGTFCNKGLLFYSEQPRAIMQVHQG